jgi:gliding motility-associated-like protein
MKNCPASKYIIFPVFVFLVQFAIAQDIDVAWVKQAGGPGEAISHSISTDASGNVFSCGLYSSTADFDPGPGVFNLTSNGAYDIFITKYSPSGNFIWARSMGGVDAEQAVSIATDAAGNVYTTGFFFATADFDPGAGIFNLISAGQRDIFVSKLDPNGNFIWAKQMGGTDYDHAWSLTVDAAGNVYSTGEFASAVADFDPGPGIFNLTSFGVPDIFISKLDAAGNFVWAKQIGGNSIDRANFISLDMTGNIYITGDFLSSNADFDPGPGSYNLSGSGGHIFVLKLDASGDFLWAKQMGSNNTEQGNALAIDNAGNVYTTGYFLGAGDYDPGPGVFTLTPAGSSGIFISKLNASGNFVWAKQFSGTVPDPRTNSGNSIAVDGSQNVYTTGGFVNTVDFDPGPGTFNRASFGEIDIFVSVLNATGDFVSVKQMGGPAIDNGLEITRDGSGNVFITGFFRQTADVDPCQGTYNLNAAGASDLLIVKFARPQVSITSSASTICAGNPVTFTAVIINPGLAPIYQWKVNGTNTGTNSTSFTSSSLNNNDQVSFVITTNPGCNPPVTATSNVLTMTVNNAVTPSVTISTASTTVCTGTAVSFTATPVNGGPSPVYQWQVNGINAGTNSAVFTSSTLVNNDVIRVLITNNSSCASSNSATSNSITMVVNASVMPSLAIAASANNICAGIAVTFTAMPVNAGAAPSFQWMRNGISVGTDNPAYLLNSPANNDNIYCIMNAVNNCGSNTIYSDTIIMIINPLPVRTINPPNPTIAPGNSVQLTATVSGSYNSIEWSPSIGLNNPSILNPLASPDTTTTYTIKAFSTNNCNASGTITVAVTNDIYIPNSFTPDGNGHNDIFRIPPGTSLTLEQFSIYNRYGNRVFYTSDISKGWDGIYGGVKADPGNYIYFITGKGNKGEVRIKGTLLLIH